MLPPILPCPGDGRPIHRKQKSMSEPRYKEPRKGVYANLDNELHERMHWRAAAADQKAAKYVAIALEFYCDIEDAFGGPITEQFRAKVIRDVAGMADSLKAAINKKHTS
jgi:hypothetical protein